MKELLLASPRGFCAGVVRAIDTVDLALKKFGPPLYVRREIVHNQSVVQKFKERGVVFIEQLSEAPKGGNVVFSAHGVSPQVRDEAKLGSLNVLDATCPLVTKVHMEVHKYKNLGYSIFLIGHADHDEVEGTMGEAPELIQLIETVEDARSIQPKKPEKIVVLTQTTLSVDETKSILNVLQERFPHIEKPSKDDICYATQNRQDAVKALVSEGIDLLLVVGSQNSSNSQRLCDVGRELGISSFLIDSKGEIQNSWLEGKQKIGLTAGASAPEYLVDEVVNELQKQGYMPRTMKLIEEDVHFSLPKALM